MIATSTIPEIESAVAPESIVIPITQIPDPVNPGHTISPSRAYRWAGPLGCWGVRLRSWMIGGRRVTSLPAIAEFFAAIEQAKEDLR